MEISIAAPSPLKWVLAITQTKRFIQTTTTTCTIKQPFINAQQSVRDNKNNNDKWKKVYWILQPFIAKTKARLTHHLQVLNLLLQLIRIFLQNPHLPHLLSFLLILLFKSNKKGVKDKKSDHELNSSKTQAIHNKNTHFKEHRHRHKLS